MLTQKKMTIPIFDVGFRVCIFDDWSEVEDIVGDSEPSKGVTLAFPESQRILVAVDRHFPSTIVHEAEHVKNYIWRFIGYKPVEDSDEVDAYLLKYIYNRIVEVFYKHIGVNPKDLIG